MNSTTIGTPAKPPIAYSPPDIAAASPKRPFLLRVARHVRVLEYAAQAAARLDALLSTVLLIHRPKWVDHGVVGLRVAQAVANELDERVHREIIRHGTNVWPCYTIFAYALQSHYHGTFCQNIHWHRLPTPDGRKVDAALSVANGPTLWVDGDVETVRELVWSTYGHAIDVNCNDDVKATPGSPPLCGHPHPVATSVTSEVRAGHRLAALFLGPPGTGKSHAAEQVAAARLAEVADCQGRPGRLLRMPDAASVSTNIALGILKHLKPDVVVVHDVDTDAPAPATLLRLVQACTERDILIVCTANSTADMHEAAFGDHRFGEPVEITSTPPPLVEAVLGDTWTQQVKQHGDTWDAVCEMPIGWVAKLRRRLDAGVPVKDAVAEATRTPLDDLPVDDAAD